MAKLRIQKKIWFGQSIQHWNFKAAHGTDMKGTDQHWRRRWQRLHGNLCDLAEVYKKQKLWLGQLSNPETLKQPMELTWKEPISIDDDDDDLEQDNLWGLVRFKGEGLSACMLPLTWALLRASHFHPMTKRLSLRHPFVKSHVTSPPATPGHKVGWGQGGVCVPRSPWRVSRLQISRHRARHP